VFIQPIFIALFPRLSALVAANDTEAAERLYRRASQLIVVASIPWAVVLGLFAPELMVAWTGDPETARATVPIVRLLVLGTALNGIFYGPYALQLAHGWLRPSLASGLVYVLVLTPVTLFLGARFGGVGVAAAWATMNVASVLIVAPLVHRGLFGRWFPEWFADLALPAAGACLVAVLCRILFSAPSVVVVGCTVAVAGGAAILLARSLLSGGVEPIRQS
jgi:O-antigen/teichoic acid export membrane protein